jgi:hypothetical protein
MSYKLSVDVIGGDELSEAFRRAPEMTSRILKDAIGKTAYLIEAKAKGYAPIRNGGLSGSIHVEGPTVTANNVEAKVGTNLKYAPYQESGTGVFAGRGMITPKRAKVLAFQKNGKMIFARAVKGVQGKFFFKKAKEEAAPILTQYMSDALGQIINFLARG